MTFRTIAFTAAALVAAPAWAQTPEPIVDATGKPAVPSFGVGDIVMDMALFPKLVTILLLIAMVAAVVVCVRKLRAGPNLAGGSAFLSSLRAGGPLLGLIGAGYGLLNISIGMMMTQTDKLLVVLPGLVESLFVALVGLLAGVFAIITHWIVEARIDRQVLKS